MFIPFKNMDYLKIVDDAIEFRCTFRAEGCTRSLNMGTWSMGWSRAKNHGNLIGGDYDGSSGCKYPLDKIDALVAAVDRYGHCLSETCKVEGFSRSADGQTCKECGDTWFEPGKKIRRKILAEDKHQPEFPLTLFVLWVFIGAALGFAAALLMVQCLSKPTRQHRPSYLKNYTQYRYDPLQKHEL